MNESGKLAFVKTAETVSFKLQTPKESHYMYTSTKAKQVAIVFAYFSLNVFKRIGSVFKLKEAINMFYENWNQFYS